MGKLILKSSGACESRKPENILSFLARLTGSTEQAPLEWKPINTMRPNAIKLLVAGSRSFNKYFVFAKYMNYFFERHPGSFVQILSGGAIGTDTLAQLYAKARGIPILIIYPDWRKFGNRAGFIRTEQLVRLATHAIIFLDGEDQEVKRIIDLCSRSPHVDSNTIHI